MRQSAEQTREEGKVISFELNEDKFWRLVADLVSGKKVVKATDVLPYWRTGMWGGSDYFMPMKKKAILMALIDEGRLSEAAGAVADRLAKSGRII
jgi:hypothetical protein